MANTFFSYPAAEVALVNGTRRGLICVNGGTNCRQIIREVSVSFKGAVPTATPVLVRLCMANAAIATGTSVSANRRRPQDISAPTLPTPFTTAREGFTIPGSGIHILKNEEVHPCGGAFLYNWWDRMDFPELLGDTTAFWIDVLMSAADTVTVAGRIEVEE